ncbi:MAG: type II toxin-antitoxin system VapC family toxin [Nitrososphaerota archaeon]|nr:type II toxin-antitoxin system VapC family toxin [Nitrososphaerota archaeon]MDG7027659.1 type II toxin-antitoxin system VapC family toxin [Nitrososphaerota archaeon]
MKFLDANPFIYAFYKPGNPLTEELKTMKDEAKSIISRINEGEERVLTSVVHVSEVANILKRRMQPAELVELVSGILTNESVQVERVTPEDYLGAVESALDLRVDPNDALAVILMRRHQIRDIYTFDRGFDRVEGIRRLPGGPDKRKEGGAE